MLLTTVALILGTVAGLALGGRLTNLATLTVRRWPLLAVGLALQSLAELVDIPARRSVLVVGLALLLAGLASNLHLRGAGVLMTGLTANLVVLVANGHVPARLDALVGAGVVDAGLDADTLVINNGLGQIETDDTVLGILGDVIPVGVISDVVSFGDLIILGGLIVATVRGLTSVPRRRGSIDVEDFLIDLTAPADEPVRLSAQGAPAPSTSEGSHHDLAPSWDASTPPSHSPGR